MERKIEEHARNYITSDYFVDNVCLSYRHDFGILPEEEKEILRQDARRWYKAWSEALWDAKYKSIVRNKEKK